MVDATTLLAASTCAALLAMLISYVVARTMNSALSAQIIGQVQSAVPQAEQLITQLRSEAGRARSLIRHQAKKANTPDDDDLLHALNHPIAQGLLNGLGIDPSRVLAGDMEELGKLRGLASGTSNDAPKYL